MGNAASKAPKAPKAVRKYPSPSTPAQTKIPFPLPAQTTQQPADVKAKLEGMSSGLDPKLAARLNELGPVTVPRPTSRIPSKPDDMMTILRNRAAISQSLEEGEDGPRKNIPIAIIKEIVLARAQGWDSAQICKEYNVDSSVVQKLDNHIAIPVDNEDGIVHSSGIQ